MPYRANRVRVSTSSSGTADFTIGSATSAAYQSYSVVPVGALVRYTAFTATEFECGEGVVSTGPVQVRTTILASSNGGAKVSFGTSPTVIIAPLVEDSREILSANRNYYVRTDGSDSNSGLFNTAGGAFLTIQKAIDVVWNTLDIGNFNVTINVGSGTFTAGVSVVGPHVGTGVISLVGAGLASTTISTTSDDAILVWYGGSLTVSDLKVQTTTDGSGMSVFGSVIFSNVAFGACASAHITAYGSVSAVGSYTINGNATSHVHAGNGAVIALSAGTVTLTGTPAFSNGFLFLATDARFITSVTYSGAATGQRFIISDATVFTDTNNLNLLPGDSAGSLLNNAYYDSYLCPDYYGQNLIHGSIECSVAANALTIAIKTDGGDDPNTSLGVNVIFRDAGASTGTVSQLVLSAATSLVVPSGATLGAVNSAPFRLWIVGFNDAGTFRLGVINCMVRGGFANNSPTQIFPLASWIPSSSTTIGTGSDSAAVYYTDTGVTAKAFTILGYLDWDSGLATAGTWASGPSRISLYRLGMPLPGQVIQTKYIENNTTTSRTASTFAASNAANSITPISAQNAIKIACMGNGTSANPTNLQLELRRGTSTTIGLTLQQNINANAILCIIMLRAIDAPGVTTSTTYTVYLASSDNTTAVNFPQSSYGTPVWSMQLDEIMG